MMREPRWIRQTRATFSAEGWMILGAVILAVAVGLVKAHLQ